MLSNFHSQPATKRYSNYGTRLVPNERNQLFSHPRFRKTKHGVWNVLTLDFLWLLSNKQNKNN